MLTTWPRIDPYLKADSSERNNPAVVTFEKYRENIRQFHPSDQRGTIDEPRLLRQRERVVKNQDWRRNDLADNARGLEMEEPITLQLAISDIERYRDSVAEDVRIVQPRNLNPKLLEPLHEEIRFAEAGLLYLQAALKAKGRTKPEHLAETLFETVNTKVQTMALFTKMAGQLKQSIPREFHSEVDRMCREAMQELEKQ